MKTNFFIILMIAAASLFAIAGGEANRRDLHQAQAAGMHARLEGENGHRTAPREAVERRNPVPADRASLLRGKKLYQRYCATCHGVSGSGDGQAGKSLTPKPANLREMGKMHTAGDLAWKIANGRDPMPAWKEVLNEFQIWDLVNFLQNLGTVVHGYEEAP